MDEHKRWLDGYWFWKGQYTSRNYWYISLNNQLEDFYDKYMSSIDPSELETDGSYFFEKFYELIDSDEELETISWLTEELRKEFIQARLVSSELRLVFQDGGRFLPASKIIQCIVDKRELWESDPAYKKWPELIKGGLRSVKLTGGDLEAWLPRYTIDLNYPIEVILENMRSHLYNLKAALSGEMKISSGAIWEKLKKSITAESMAKYETSGDESRAIGLWLFDYIEEMGFDPANPPRGKKSEAYRAIKEALPKELDLLGKAASSERQYARWLNNTIQCVDSFEVLKI